MVEVRRYPLSLLALFILLAVGIIGLCRCDSRQRKLIWEQMGDFFRSETEQAFGPDTKLPELVIDEQTFAAVR